MRKFVYVIWIVQVFLVFFRTTFSFLDQNHGEERQCRTGELRGNQKLRSGIK